MLRRDVTFTCGEIALEGILEIPAAADGPCPAAVVCHPHPLYGGNMHNNVTEALGKGLVDRGFVSLRFNFRGTGGSRGSHGEGISERDDVAAAVDFLQGQEEVDSERMIIAGYSFGCWVALAAAAEDSRLKRLIGISPPVDMYDFSFLNHETRPKLLVAGDNDFVCSVSGFKRLGDETPEPKRIVTIPGTDHFHGGREDLLIREMNTFLDSYPIDRT